jgi:hypothetical protein
MRRSTAAVSLCLWLLSTFAATATASAEDGWKPFAERDAAKARRGAANDPRPTLPAMDGTLGRSGSAGATADAAADRGPGGSSSGGSPGGSSYVNPDGRPLTSGQPGGAAPLAGAGSKIDREELAPIGAVSPIQSGGMATSGDGAVAGDRALPSDVWRGLDLAKLEQLLAKLDMPPRSPALHALWRRLLSSDTGAASGTVAEPQPQILAVRADALHRSGLIRDQAELLARTQDGPEGGVLTAMRARADIAAGRRDSGCGAAKAASLSKAELPKRLRQDVMVMTGYCAAADGNGSAAGLAAELIRDAGFDAPGTLALLDAVAAGPTSKGKMALPKQLDAIDIRLMQLLGNDAITPAAIERADAAGLAVIAGDPTADPKLRLIAAEAAAKLNVIAPEQLGEIYRAMVFPTADIAEALGSKAEPVVRRALLFKAAEVERTPLKKVRVVRALLDDAKRVGLYLPLLRGLAPSITSLPQISEIGWFAETAIEISIAAANYDAARSWVAFASKVDRPGSVGSGQGSMLHWAALIDIADPQIKTARGQSLASVEDVALKGRFTAIALHKLATVLDALDADVPIPLWDAANKSPQPAGGHLPETGVLPELQDASKKKEFGRTVLLSIRAFGANSADGAHILALGDTIRALKRAGLETDARQVGFEALFAVWPRGQTN